MNWITALGSIATVGLLIVGVLTLKDAEHELAEAARIQKAELRYKIAIDQMNTLSVLLQDPDVYNYVFEHDEGKAYIESLVNKSNREIHKAFMFIAAVHQLRLTGLIENDTWRVMYSAFCGFRYQKPVQHFWENQIQGGSWNEEFKSLECP